VRSEHIYAARSRWRADLLDFGANLHDGFGDRVTAATKRGEADLYRLEADLLDAVGATKDAFAAARVAAVDGADKATLRALALNQTALNDLPGVAEAKDAMHAARDELRDTVTTWRRIDDLFGNRARHSILNNFTEPTSAELVATLEGGK
jgi:conjugal transfer/entry exclusion protein